MVRQVKYDMRDWALAKIVWVAHRGFASKENRRCLRQGDNHYIIGEKLRSGSAEAKAARGSSSATTPKAPSETPPSAPACSPGATWPAVRRELNRIALGTFTGPAGTFRQRTELTKAQRDILAQLKIEPSPRICQLTTEAP